MNSAERKKVRPGLWSRRQVVAGLGAAGAVAATGHRPARSQNNRIVVYSTTLPPIQRKVVEAFTRKTGIEVQSLRLTTSPLAQRFLAEQEAGQHICDVVTLGNDVFFNMISERGFLANIDDVPSVAKLSPEWRRGSYYTMIMYGPSSLAYNTSNVTGSLVPKGWEDVLNPAFANQLIMPDPRINDTIVGFVNMLHNAFGDDYVRKLGSQKPKLVPATQQGVEQVIAGEALLIVPCLAMNLIQYEGMNAPVAVIPTPSPANGTYFFSGIAQNAPNAEGARLWYEFLLSEEGQEILCRNNGVSPLGQIPGSLQPPKDLVEFDLRAAMDKAPLLFDLLGLAA